MAVVRVKVEQNEAFKPLDEGRYEGFLSDPEIVPPKEEGKFPYLKFQFRTEDPTLGEKSINCIFSFSPKAVWRLIAVFETLEIPFEIEKDEETGEETVLFDPEDIAGKSVLAQLEQEAWKSTKNGKERSGIQNKVTDFYLPVG